MRFQGSALVKRYKGDREAAQQYLPVARTLLGRMLAYLGPGISGARRWVLPNGVVIRTLMAGNVPMVEIDVTPVAPVVVAGSLVFPLVQGICFRPSSLSHPDGIAFPAPSPFDPLVQHSEVVIDELPGQERITWFHNKASNLGNFMDPGIEYYKWPKRVAGAESNLPDVHDRLLHGGNYWFSRDRKEVLSWESTGSIKFLNFDGYPQSDYEFSGPERAVRGLPLLSPRDLGLGVAIFYRGHVVRMPQSLLDEIVIPAADGDGVDRPWSMVTSAAFIEGEDEKPTRNMVFTLMARSGFVLEGQNLKYVEGLFVGRMGFRKDGVPELKGVRRLATQDYDNLITNDVDWQTEVLDSGYLGGIGGNFSPGVAAVNTSQVFWNFRGDRAVGTRCVEGYLRRVSVTVSVGESISETTGAIVIGADAGSYSVERTYQRRVGPGYAQSLITSSSTESMSLRFALMNGDEEVDLEILTEYSISGSDEREAAPFPVPDRSVPGNPDVGERFGSIFYLNTESEEQFSESLRYAGSVVASYSHAESSTRQLPRRAVVGDESGFGFPLAFVYQGPFGVDDGFTEITRSKIPELPLKHIFMVTVVDPANDVVIVEETAADISRTVDFTPIGADTTFEYFFGAGYPRERSRSENGTVAKQHQSTATISGQPHVQTVDLGTEVLDSDLTQTGALIIDTDQYPSELVGGGPAPPEDFLESFPESASGNIRADFLMSWLSGRPVSLTSESGVPGDFPIGPPFPRRIGMSPVFNQANRTTGQQYAIRGEHTFLHYKCGLYGFNPTNQFVIPLIEQMRDQVLVVDTLGLLGDVILFPGDNKGAVDVGIL
ncbi:hypothetical protein JN531_003725 [Flagellatimonas centrodinii]|uniref:hypothetical protein n=1 Tax=Flagellatimonas centrodinii TaxID=2806210 RepID=UPI001FEEEEDB|nr:hypothetical protein [Flagellatimonas centrodinii]ULQ47396.1 hypothetical protein JN531_003725 [Flagellatimonas centrodinii]